MKRLLVSAVMVGAALAVPAAAVPASAETSMSAPVSAVVSAHACKYRRDGRVWRCVTPGAYCPKAAHGRYGYAKVTGKRYKCVQYTRTTWRWKRA